MQSDRRGVGVTCHKCILFVYKTKETWDRKINDFLEFLFLYGGGRLEARVVPPVVHPPIFWRQPAPFWEPTGCNRGALCELFGSGGWPRAVAGQPLVCFYSLCDVPSPRPILQGSRQ